MFLCVCVSYHLPLPIVLLLPYWYLCIYISVCIYLLFCFPVVRRARDWSIISCDAHEVPRCTPRSVGASWTKNAYVGLSARQSPHLSATGWIATGYIPGVAVRAMSTKRFTKHHQMTMAIPLDGSVLCMCVLSLPLGWAIGSLSVIQ